MKHWYVAIFLLMASITLLACGAAAQERAPFDGDEMTTRESSAAAPAMAQDSFGVIAEAESGAVPSAMPTAVPAPMAESMEMAETSAQSIEVSMEEYLQESPEESLPNLDEVQASVSAQERIIVRTVDMGLIVEDVPQSVDRVAEVAGDLGGWAVSSDRSAIHRGNVSVRVPAQQLDEAVKRIRALGVRVEWESSTSQDVTDEYVDTSSRLRSLWATEQALLDLLNKADKVEDALEVQRELTFLQAEIESLEGRIKFLEQTAAFSLINVFLTLAPRDMAVNAGADQTFSVGQPARFRATFTPPEGIDSFSFRWDFGDGRQAEGTGTAPTAEPGQRVTATVTHFFEDDRDSPYIVQLELTGTGTAGLVEGEDTIIATVTRVPTIEVFAGESRVVEEGDEVEYVGSFTRGDGLRDLQYRWDFGDGSPTVIGAPEEGATRVAALHTFENYRPRAYEVTLTVTAQSDAGEVKGSDKFYVDVNESQGLVVGNWDLVESSRWAIRSLSAVALAVVNVVIWAIVFSPVLLALAAAGYGLYRLNRYRRARRDRRQPNAGTELSTMATPPNEPPAAGGQ